jgi:hypothetical protein
MVTDSSATGLVPFDLEDADDVVADGVTVGGAFGSPLERRPVHCGHNVARLGSHLTEGISVFGPELAQTVLYRKSSTFHSASTNLFAPL